MARPLRGLWKAIRRLSIALVIAVRQLIGHLMLGATA
jgi:hypothetical protein